MAKNKVKVLICACGATAQDNSSERGRFKRRHTGTVAHLEAEAERIRGLKLRKPVDDDRLRLLELELYRRRNVNG